MYHCHPGLFSLMKQCPTITSAAELVLTSWPLLLDVSPSLSDMWGATWPHDPSPASNAHKHKARLRCFAACLSQCWAVRQQLSQILHHHHVFIRAGGGRAGYEAERGETQTHTGPSRHIFHAKKLCRKTVSTPHLFALFPNCDWCSCWRMTRSWAARAGPVCSGSPALRRAG